MRTEKLEGRDHFVVPVVMIRVGTWSGSDGPVQYPSNALNASVEQWNGKPIVVYHPNQRGKGFAGHPEVFNKQKIGVIFNTTFEGGKLRAEAWLDVIRLSLVDSRITQALKKGQPIEVSTGVGVAHNGFKTADGAIIAENLIPDHLAILPTGAGACSIEDGAGLLMNECMVLGLPKWN